MRLSFTESNNNDDRFMALCQCPGLPRWAGSTEETLTHPP